ncbi:MAG: hypothetical protein AB7L71_08105 [Vicinamibacterales bacterium]
MTRRAMFSVLAGMVAAVAWMQVGVAAQSAATSLGTVRLSRAVMADGKTLPAGSYTLRVSNDPVQQVVGQADSKWIEFVQGGDVKGRELASVIPSADVKALVKGTAPAANSNKVELLKGGEYLRVWANRGGSHYLIHLVVGS